MHNHQNHGQLAGRLRFAVTLSSIILIGEVLGGVFANSLALLSDAGHVFTDVLALSLSWFAVRQAARPPTARMTYGFHRIGVLVAIINAVTIIAIALVIFYEAAQRLRSPQEVHSVLMLSVAAVGLVANGVVVWMLFADQKQNINIRSAFLHALGDGVASVGVIVGGVIIFYTDWFWIDPVVSIFIGTIIGFAAWRIVKEAIAIFLEAAPPEVDPDRLSEDICRVPGVKAVHHLHVWSLASQLHALSAHVLIDDQAVSEGAAIRQRINHMLSERYNIGHATVQMECESCDPSTLLCPLGVCHEEPEEARDHTGQH